MGAHTHGALLAARTLPSLPPTVFCTQDVLIGQSMDLITAHALVAERSNDKPELIRVCNALQERNDRKDLDKGGRLVLAKLWNRLGAGRW